MEYLDLYDENQNLIGEKVLRSKDMKPQIGKYIKKVIVFIENNEGKFLIQKTSKKKVVCGQQQEVLFQKVIRQMKQ